jgi:membrane fusion protein (multidrug efflux system)
VQQNYPVLTVSQSEAEISESYSASIRGRQDIEIYPQVSGTIFRLKVGEGAKVRKGDVLFIIDQVPYRAALRTAEANVHAAKAQVETAELDYTGKQELFRGNVISDYELSMARNALTVARANLEHAKAEKVNARNSLSYTSVKSPSNGVIGTLPYREGTLVSPTMAQPLTTVSDNAEMYVYFSMTENQLRAYVRQYGSPDETIRQMPPVQLQLNDGTMYGPKGRIETISGIVNSQTGTVSVRSVFPNLKHLLWSGGIGNVVISHIEKNVIVIPQSAVSELQDKQYVYKVINGKAVLTFIKVERLNNGTDYIVRKGLKQGDVIVSEGTGLLRDGMEIRIKTKKN